MYLTRKQHKTQTEFLGQLVSDKSFGVKNRGVTAIGQNLTITG